MSLLEVNKEIKKELEKEGFSFEEKDYFFILKEYTSNGVIFEFDMKGETEINFYEMIINEVNYHLNCIQSNDKSYFDDDEETNEYMRTEWKELLVRIKNLIEKFSNTN